MVRKVPHILASLLVHVYSPSLCAEHIWWDQATVFVQIGIIPSHVLFGEEKKMLRLPAAGAECARLLADETDGTSNEMFGSDWGIQDA